jgi:hypothetical protein
MRSALQLVADKVSTWAKMWHISEPGGTGAGRLFYPRCASRGSLRAEQRAFFVLVEAHDVGSKVSSSALSLSRSTNLFRTPQPKGVHNTTINHTILLID